MLHGPMNTVKQRGMHARALAPARITALGAVLVVAGCGLLPEVLPTPTCDPTEFGQPPALTCEVAVRAAVAALPEQHRRIVAVEFRYGGLCPPNARCLFTGSDHGTVIVTFAGGQQISIQVAVQEGRLVTEPPAEYPPPGWEL
jgi:hypothetical protein